jgi:hypothetical protein
VTLLQQVSICGENPGNLADFSSRARQKSAGTGSESLAKE